MSINFKQILERRISNAVGEDVMDLEATAEELRAAECGLCQLFGSASPLRLEGSNQTCHLRAFSAKRTFGWLHNGNQCSMPDTIILGVVSLKRDGPRYITADNYPSMRRSLLDSGYLSLLKAPEDLAHYNFSLIDPKSFDVDFARNCMNYCRLFHGEPCKARLFLNEILASH